MGLTRIALCFAFAGSLATACAAGGHGGGGSGGSDGTGGANCGASVVCGGGLTYQKCTSSNGGCYIELSSGGQVSCTVSNPCTASPDGGGSGGTTGSGGTMGSGGTTGSGGSAGSSGVPEGGTSCSSIADAGSCVTCCEGLYMSGAKTYYTTWETCLCTSPGVCATECSSTLCAGMPTTPGSACDTCVSGSVATSTSTCSGPIQTACSADPTCVQFVTCGNACP